MLQYSLDGVKNGSFGKYNFIELVKGTRLLKITNVVYKLLLDYVDDDNKDIYIIPYNQRFIDDNNYERNDNFCGIIYENDYDEIYVKYF